jgi:type I restriction enzyme S subunit
MVGSKVSSITRQSLLSTIVVLPPLPIQRRIATILSAADREIDLLRQDLEQEERKKKALMQLLLTGIVRVKEAAGCRFSTQMKERT